MQEKQLKILEEFIKLINSSSEFSEYTLYSAGSKLEITKGEIDILFPYKMFGIAKILWEKHINEISASKENGITEGVKNAVLSSLSLLMPYKRAVRKVFKFLILPQNIIFAGKFFWNIADAIWKKLEVNDSSFKFYTRRAILSSIYGSCFLHFLISRDFAKTESLLKSQLELLQKITKR
jgi:rpsU-divergently transcribed protein